MKAFSYSFPTLILSEVNEDNWSSGRQAYYFFLSGYLQGFFLYVAESSQNL